MQISVWTQAASFVGALFILVAYAGHQLKWMSSERFSYNLLNAVGSAILAWVAFRPFQVGFVVLEVAWAFLSCYAMLRSFRARPAR
jgi:hypothetical protein